MAVLDVDVGLGVLAFLAENELGDETVEVVLELAGVVSSVDDPAVVGGVRVRLSPQLKAEVLDDVWMGLARGTVKTWRDTHKQEGGPTTGRRCSG